MDAERTDQGRAATLARLRLGNLRGYLRDLEAYQAGDHGRFARMVDAQGKQIATPERWGELVAHALADPELQTYCAAGLEEARTRALALGIGVPHATDEE